MVGSAVRSKIMIGNNDFMKGALQTVPPWVLALKKYWIQCLWVRITIDKFILV